VQHTDLASRSGGDTFLLWQRMLHEGSAFGGVGRFATFFGGLLPPLLMVTGFIMWLQRRRLKRRAPGATWEDATGTLTGQPLRTDTGLKTDDANAAYRPDRASVGRRDAVGSGDGVRSLTGSE